jgi:AsnC-type helix-turn-helix domain
MLRIAAIFTNVLHMEQDAVSPVPDATDRRILRALQRDGRISNVELAREVGSARLPAGHTQSGCSRVA